MSYYCTPVTTTTTTSIVATSEPEFSSCPSSDPEAESLLKLKTTSLEEQGDSNVTKKEAFDEAFISCDEDQPANDGQGKKRTIGKKYPNTSYSKKS